MSGAIPLPQKALHHTNHSSLQRLTSPLGLESGELQLPRIQVSSCGSHDRRDRIALAGSNWFPCMEPTWLLITAVHRWSVHQLHAGGVWRCVSRRRINDLVYVAGSYRMDLVVNGDSHAVCVEFPSGAACSYAVTSLVRGVIPGLEWMHLTVLPVMLGRWLLWT